MKRGLIIAAVVVVLGVIIFFSVRGSGDDGEKVYTEPAKSRKIEAIVNAPGEIDPRVKVNISAHIVGKIEHLYFNEGDSVRKGQKLVDLEKYTFVAARDRMRADLGSHRVEVIRAKAALATADLEYKRALSMQRQGIQAQELFEKAHLDRDNAQAGYDSAIQGVNQSEAGLAQAEDDLSRTTIVSPIDGKVVQLNAHEGEVVITGTMNNPGSVIAVIADLSEILVEAQVGETEVVGIRQNQEAKVHVDAVTDKEYQGRVIEIGSSAAVQATAGSGIRYFTVKVEVENPDERLRPGMTSEVSIVTSSVEKGVTVPIQSVVARVPGAKNDDEADDDTTPKKKYVFVVRNNVAKMTEVTTGISDATHVVVVSGAKADEPVITGPYRTLKKLHDGDHVKVVKEETTKTSTSED